MAATVPKVCAWVQDIVFNVDGLWLAVRVSYSWEHGEDTLFTLFGGGYGCIDGVGEKEEGQGERLWSWQEG